ncbi:hypothetical protein ACHAXT_005028 [Thalassiosira profunda]
MKEEVGVTEFRHVALDMSGVGAFCRAPRCLSSGETSGGSAGGRSVASESSDDVESDGTVGAGSVHLAKMMLSFRGPAVPDPPAARSGSSLSPFAS